MTPESERPAIEAWGDRRRSEIAHEMRAIHGERLSAIDSVVLRHRRQNPHTRVGSCEGCRCAYVYPCDALVLAYEHHHAAAGSSLHPGPTDD